MARAADAIADDPLAEFDISVGPTATSGGTACGVHQDDLFEEALNLEQHYYNLGYQEGIDTPNSDANHDGRLLGVQTGFQKFLVLGATLEFTSDLILLAESHVTNNLSSDSQGKPRNYPRVLSQLQNLRDSLVSTFDIREGTPHVDNSPESVDRYDRALSASRGKLIALSTQLGKQAQFAQLERACQVAAGKTPEAKITVDDGDLW